MDFTIPDNFHCLDNIVHSKIDFDKEAELFSNVINKSSKENDIQQYIKNNKKWFIPASLSKDYDFGHHSAYLTSEQALGAEYRADYMLLGQNSLGYHLVLVEFENANVDYVLKTSNCESEYVRKGLTQIRDWMRWMDNNRQYFFDSCGISQIGKSIPSWGINYCLVVSRRERMSERANQLRRQSQQEIHRLRIVTYDRLVDNTKKLTNGF